jgi:hypothetical protein
LYEQRREPLPPAPADWRERYCALLDSQVQRIESALMTLPAHQLRSIRLIDRLLDAMRQMRSMHAEMVTGERTAAERIAAMSFEEQVAHIANRWEQRGVDLFAPAFDMVFDRHPEQVAHVIERTRAWRDAEASRLADVDGDAPAVTEASEVESYETPAPEGELKS